jgi:hypothetical protein
VVIFMLQLILKRILCRTSIPFDWPQAYFPPLDPEQTKVLLGLDYDPQNDPYFEVAPLGPRIIPAVDAAAAASTAVPTRRSTSKRPRPGPSVIPPPTADSRFHCLFNCSITGSQHEQQPGAAAAAAAAVPFTPVPIRVNSAAGTVETLGAAPVLPPAREAADKLTLLKWWREDAPRSEAATAAAVAAAANKRTRYNGSSSSNSCNGADAAVEDELLQDLLAAQQKLKAVHVALQERHNPEHLQSLVVAHVQSEAAAAAAAAAAQPGPEHDAQVMEKWTVIMAAALAERLATAAKEREDQEALCFVCGAGDAIHLDQIVFCDRYSITLYQACVERDPKII